MSEEKHAKQEHLEHEQMLNHEQILDPLANQYFEISFAI